MMTQTTNHWLLEAKRARRQQAIETTLLAVVGALLTLAFIGCFYVSAN